MNSHPLNNRDGSVMVMVLLILAIMTVIGVVSSGTVVEENFMIRNVGIHKENVNLLDSALMEGLQRYMQIDDSNFLNFDANGPNGAWINNIHNDPPAVGDPEEFINTIWYERNFTQRCLDAANSMDANLHPVLNTRGENANGNLRFGIVGWEPVNLGPNWAVRASWLTAVLSGVPVASWRNTYPPMPVETATGSA